IRAFGPPRVGENGSTTELASCDEGRGSEIGHRKAGSSEGGPTSSVPDRTHDRASRPDAVVTTRREDRFGLTVELPKNLPSFPLPPVNKNSGARRAGFPRGFARFEPRFRRREEEAGGWGDVPEGPGRGGPPLSLPGAGAQRFDRAPRARPPTTR